MLSKKYIKWTKAFAKHYAYKRSYTKGYNTRSKRKRMAKRGKDLSPH